MEQDCNYKVDVELNCCANCTKPFKTGDDHHPMDLSDQALTNSEFYFSCLSTHHDSSAAQKVTVQNAVYTIYNLHRVEMSQVNGDGYSERNFDKSQVNVCFNCERVLSNLYKFYEEFNQLRESSSLIARKIQQFQQLLDKTLDEQRIQSVVVEPYLNIDKFEALDEDCQIKDDDDDDWDPNFHYLSSQPQVQLTRLTSTEILNATRKIQLDDDPNFIPGSRLKTDIGNGFKCLQCGKTYLRAESLEIHRRRHVKGKDRPYGCPNCSNYFTHISALRRHERRFHGAQKSQRRARILKSVQKTSDNSRLSNHSNLLSKENETGNDDPKMTKPFSSSSMDSCLQPVKKFSCSTCSKSFGRIYDLRQHLRVHTKERPYGCPHCAKYFTHISALRRHERRFHGAQKSTRKSRILFKKREEQTVSSSDDSNSRSTENDNQTNPRISIPPSTSFSDSPLDPIKKFDCTTCSKSFIRFYDLRQHMRVHTKERPYGCQTCSKYFTHISALRRHERRFHGAQKSTRKSRIEAKRSKEAPRSFLCSFCGRTFAHKSKLESHIMFHAEARNFKCENCDKSFKNLSILKRHQQTHAVVKNYLCTYCGKGFYQSQGLKIHLQVHTGIKPYICRLCGLAFGYNKPLKKHLTQCHGEEYEALAGIFKTTEPTSNEGQDCSTHY